MRISDWSSDVCSSDLGRAPFHAWQAHQETTGHKPPVNGDAMESQELRRAGLKVTHPRMRILELLEQRSAHHHMPAEDIYRSEERRVGQEGVSTCRIRRTPDHKKKKAERRGGTEKIK